MRALVPTHLAVALLAVLPTARGAQPEVPAISLEVARRVLFEADKAVKEEACVDGGDGARIACLIDARFAADEGARKLARTLYERSGTVAGLLPEEDFDGSYRGKLHLVPRLPVGPNRVHLEWASAALLEFEDFFGEIGKRAGEPLRYRWKPIELRFFESVKRRTPSAWAFGWQISYNVAGSLFTSADGVRETLFHEVFHLNDFARADWSRTALGAVYDAIVARCGTRVACLEPYAPDRIIVRGGTYYAFMPDNGVKEYAADVAKRWYVENRAALRKQKIARPFKCVTPENARAWAAVAGEFFGGVDLVPGCPK